MMHCRAWALFASIPCTHGLTKDYYRGSSGGRTVLGHYRRPLPMVLGGS